MKPTVLADHTEALRTHLDSLTHPQKIDKFCRQIEVVDGMFPGACLDVVNVDALDGRMLVLHLIRAMGHVPYLDGRNFVYRSEHGSWVAPVVDDAQAMELVRDFWIGLNRPSKGVAEPLWTALGDVPDRTSDIEDYVVSSSDLDPCIAVARCLVATRFGKTLVVVKE